MDQTDQLSSDTLKQVKSAANRFWTGFRSSKDLINVLSDFAHSRDEWKLRAENAEKELALYKQPINAPLTDVPMDRQIEMLNKQNGDLAKERDDFLSKNEAADAQYKAAFDAWRNQREGMMREIESLKSKLSEAQTECVDRTKESLSLVRQRYDLTEKIKTLEAKLKAASPKIHRFKATHATLSMDFRGGSVSMTPGTVGDVFGVRVVCKYGPEGSTMVFALSNYAIRAFRILTEGIINMMKMDEPAQNPPAPTQELVAFLDRIYKQCKLAALPDEFLKKAATDMTAKFSGTKEASRGPNEAQPSPIPLEERYGYHIIDTPEKKALFAPRVEGDQRLDGCSWAFGPQTFCELEDSRFLDKYIYRRKIDVGEGYELVPLDERIKEGDEVYSSSRNIFMEWVILKGEPATVRGVCSGPHSKLFIAFRRKKPAPIPLPPDGMVVMAWFLAYAHPITAYVVRGEWIHYPNRKNVDSTLIRWKHLPA